MKDYNAVIDEKNFFDQPINNNLKTYESIRKSATSRDDYTIVFWLDYIYFKNYYKMIAVDFMLAINADPKAIQQII